MEKTLCFIGVLGIIKMKIFGEKEIQESIEQVLQSKPVQLEYEFRDPDDFNSSSSEEHIRIIRGYRPDFGSLISFWLKALEKIFEERFDGDLDYYNWFNGQCVPIEKDKFLKKVNFIEGLKHPIEISDNYLEYYQIWNEWNEIAVIGVSENELLLFNWYTTA